AFLLRPDSGLAFNQLGNLYADVGGLHSVYYLLYSIQSASTYDGSYSNLRQLLDRKIVHFARLPASVESRPMDTLVNNILSLMYYFLYEHTQLQNYERHCQEALTNFTERLVTFDPELDEKFLFQLSSVCVMMVWRLQVTNSVHTSAAVGFAISVFCQLVNHLTTILEQHSHVKLCSSEGVALSPSPMPSDVDQISVTSVSGSRIREVETDEFDAKQSSQEDGDKNDFTAPKRRKRRRRGRGISDSESEGSDYGTPDFIYTDEEELENSEASDNDWEINSEDEEMNFNGSIPEEDCKFKSSRAFDSSSSNGNSDASVTKTAPELEINGLDNSAAIGAVKTENYKQKFMIPVEDLMKCRSQVEASLVALSPFLRWIQASPVIKDALAANVEKAFLEKLCSTLNLLISQNWPSLLDDLSISEELKSDWKTLCEEPVNEKSIFKWELEEDRSALGIPHFQDFLKDLRIQSVNLNDALVIRIGRMVAFGSWLVSTENFSILYSAEELNYFVPNPQTLKAYLLQSKLKRLRARLGNGTSDELDKLTKAYKDMKISNETMEKASRRNRDDREPRRNRRRRGGGGGAGRRSGGVSTSDPVYAVIDLEALIKRFYDVKRVAANKKFIVVIPHSAWKTLDMLKDSEEEDAKNARIAFRWLEGAIKRKHPGLILQKDQQKMEINFPYPKDPIDVDAWDYFDMMECCNYITNTWLKNKPRSNEVIWGDVRDKCRVFFLTGREDLLNTRIPRSFDPVKIARNVGIFVDYIVPYPGLGRGKKWKSVAKTNG
ncbi:Protein SMG5, partial [Orchesella cincta]